MTTLISYLKRSGLPQRANACNRRALIRVDLLHWLIWCLVSLNNRHNWRNWFNDRTQTKTEKQATPLSISVSHSGASGGPV